VASVSSINDICFSIITLLNLNERKSKT